MDESERLLALAVLREEDPESHHLDCPDIIVSAIEELRTHPDPEGEGGHVIGSWKIQCPHSAAFTEVSFMGYYTRRRDEGEANPPS